MISLRDKRILNVKIWRQSWLSGGSASFRQEGEPERRRGIRRSKRGKRLDEWRRQRRRRARHTMRSLLIGANGAFGVCVVFGVVANIARFPGLVQVVFVVVVFKCDGDKQDIAGKKTSGYVPGERRTFV